MIRQVLRRSGLLLATLGVITSVSPALAGEVKFTPEDGHAYNPSFSKDGKWVAFEVNRYDGGSIDMYVGAVKSNGIVGDASGNTTKVTLAGASQFGSGGQVLMNPTWHPAGLAVFEGQNQGGQYRLYLYAPGGASPTELIASSKVGGGLTFPAVSPDGNKLAFVADVTGSGDIRDWDRTKDVYSSLTATTNTESFPIYSADGTKMLFNRRSGGNEDIFLLDLATKTEKSIIAVGGDQSRAIYAGSNIVYFTNERGTETWDIGVTDGAGENKRVLAKDVRLPLRARPAITPDGKYVAWTSNKPEDSTKVFITAIDGSKTVAIPTDFNGCGEPALGVQAGKTLLAFTYLQSNGADWRHLFVMDITDKL